MEEEWRDDEESARVIILFSFYYFFLYFCILCLCRQPHRGQPAVIMPTLLASQQATDMSLQAGEMPEEKRDDEESESEN